ncbi:type VII secretion-associated serine protease mycosin [Micromonospora nigra]|uniref:Type VII secretion-associated serine protease mycosin n=1 Tax=Micromonospora nigra TaxID=145857 RepID=A0A1C6RWJ0_9ACTN|nr:S8 family serine peptidase [Micromonospora nigra]SCL21584.1 type VII secretion-associated serine protease mycosin [Micromonospora nigra]
MRVRTRPALALTSAVASVLVSLVLPATPARADDIRADSWHVKALELAELHKITQGEGVVVAVVDTGVDATHPDLRDNVLPGVDLFDDGSRGRVDRQGHGTGMASLIAGHGHGPGGGDGVLGVAPRAKILPVTVQGERSSVIAPSAVAAGIQWAIDAGADIINVSLSSSHHLDLDRAVERAYQKGVVVVAGVGNRSDVVIGNPARHPGAVAVNGTTRTDTVSREAALPAEEVDIAAPGEDLIQAIPGRRYATATGSSGAAAIVSGALALIKARYPDLTAYQMFQRLLETSRDVGDKGKDLDHGWGVLDLRRALTGEPDGRAGHTPAAKDPVQDPDLAGARSVAGPGAEETLFVVLLWVGFLVIAAGAVATVLVLRRRAAPEGR